MGVRFEIARAYFVFAFPGEGSTGDVRVGPSEVRKRAGRGRVVGASAVRRGVLEAGPQDQGGGAGAGPQQRGGELHEEDGAPGDPQPLDALARRSQVRATSDAA